MSIADDHESIRRRLEELAAERNLVLTGTSIPVEAPKDNIDWTGWNMYSAPSDDTA